MLQIIVFILVVGAVGYFAYGRYATIYRNIQLGQPIEMTGNKAERWRNVLLIAFGQKKMFKRWIPGVLHFFIYAAFLLTQIELIEILIDGVTGRHRVFAEGLGGLYTFTINFIEILSILALVGTVVFLWRRNVRKVPRFQSPEMTGWPFLDANLILIGELLLITGIFSMNAADGLLQSIDPAHYPDTGTLLISSVIGKTFMSNMSTASLMVVERFGWWLHLLAVLGFILYLPFSKHLHIFLAFFNTYFSSLAPRGRMTNMPEIAKEVRVMMGLDAESGEMSDELPEFGAKDIFGLSRATLLGAYACTECGRCTSVCPANITGKKLSPRKVMMDIRDRMEDVRKQLNSNQVTLPSDKGADDNAAFDDGKSLFDYITKEEIHACTTCNACVEACPVLINPLTPILALRRYDILTESAGPPDWVPMFNSLESSQSPWQIPDARNQWAQGLRDK